MQQLDFHNNEKTLLTPPPLRLAGVGIQILRELNRGYKIWHGFLQHLPRPTRHSIGLKIDNVFTDIIEMALIAEYSEKVKKLLVLEKMSQKFDLLKYFITMLWEIKMVEEKQFSIIAVQLNSIGKMLGGWIKSTKKEMEKQTPPNFSGGE